MGDLIVYMPPKRRRRHPILLHDECAREYGQSRSRTGAWRANRSWMSAEDFAVVENAMSRQVAA